MAQFGQRCFLVVGMVCGVAAVMLCGSQSHAQQARDLLRQAATLFSEARFNESLGLLTRARAVATDDATRARIQLYLGLNHAVLGQGEKARAGFRSALALDPALMLDPGEIKSSIVDLFNSVRQAMSSELMVLADRPDAEVYIDGKKVGGVPFRDHVTVGPHRVDVRTPDGCLGYWKGVVLHVGRKHAVTARLRSPAEGGKGCVAASLPSGPSFWRRRRVWTWVAAGAAGLMLAAGIGVGASANSDYSEYESTSDPDRGQDLARTIESKDLAANLLFGVGWTLAVTSVVLLFVEGRPAEQGATVGIGPLGGRLPGLMLSGRF